MNTKVEKVKAVIAKNIEDALCGIFDCCNLVGDPMETLYKDDAVQVDICYGWGYFEVFGLTDKEFAEVKSFYVHLNVEQ